MTKSDKKSVKIVNKSGPFGFMFFLAYIGAAIYFIQQTDGFWNVILALLKAAVWPVFVVHRALELLNI